MCVAAVIKKPVSLDYLKEMAESNPHGGGVAWPDYAAGVMRFKKGLTHEQIHAMQEAGELAYPYLLHFRWATEGDNVPQMTHPFPVGVRALFGELGGAADQVLIHNGTMSWSQQKFWIPDTDYMYHLPWELINRASDTAIAAWLIKEPGSDAILGALAWATCLASVRDGELVLEKTGDWKEHEGNSYSNLHWLPYRSRFPGAASGGGHSYFRGSGSGGWDWEGEEWGGGHAWGRRALGAGADELGGVRGGNGGVGRGVGAASGTAAGDASGKGGTTADSADEDQNPRRIMPGHIKSGMNYVDFSRVAEHILGPEPKDYDAPKWGERFVTWFEGKQNLMLLPREELDELISLVDVTGSHVVRVALEAEFKNQDKDKDKESQMLSKISQRHFASFEEYCRVKYGDEVADAACDPDLVSEDPEQVNAWLAERMIG